jgi:hypothetical protein
MKYLTKGDLLKLIGPETADSFTAFMSSPESFGVTGDLLTKLHLAKQQFDWTNGIDIDDPAIQQLLPVLSGYGVFSQETLDALNAVPDIPELDSYVVNVIAQDDITVSNVGGAVQAGNRWAVQFDFVNNTKGTTVSETEHFDVCPDMDMLNAHATMRMKQLKQTR